MNEMVRVAVAGDVTEAEEIQEILRSAGIDAELADGEDDSVTVSVPESSVEQAKDAIEAMTEPDDIVGEPSRFLVLSGRSLPCGASRLRVVASHQFAVA